MAILAFLLAWVLPALLCWQTGFGQWIAGIHWIWFTLLSLGWFGLAYILTFVLTEEIERKEGWERVHRQQYEYQLQAYRRDVERAEKERENKRLVGGILDVASTLLFGAAPGAEKYLGAQGKQVEAPKAPDSTALDSLKFIRFSARWMPVLILLAARLLLRYDLLKQLAG